MRSFCWILIALLSIPGLALGLDIASRPVGPVMTWNPDQMDRYDPSWLHVKFVEGSRVRLDGERFIDDSGLDLSSLDATLARADVRQVRRTFRGDPAELRALKRIGEARSGVTGPDLSLWFDIEVAGGGREVAPARQRTERPLRGRDRPPGADRRERDEQHRRARSDLADPRVGTPNFVAQQGYLGAAPTGLNAGAAWIVAGGHGEGQHFIDVELCWTENHEDFNYANNFYIGGATQDPSYETHGTAVLGEIIGQNNGFGINGFSPAVQYGVVAVTVAEWPNVPHYFQEAIDHLSAGDVWLIELQMYPQGRQATPMEWLQVNYDVIWTGCWARGIVCMEAGANGSQNLDDASWGGVFDRNVRDSGAIMVAAGTPTGLVAEYFTNYGKPDGRPRVGFLDRDDRLRRPLQRRIAADVLHGAVQRHLRRLSDGDGRGQLPAGDRARQPRLAPRPDPPPDDHARHGNSLQRHPDHRAAPESRQRGPRGAGDHRRDGNDDIAPIRCLAEPVELRLRDPLQHAARPRRKAGDLRRRRTTGPSRRGYGIPDPDLGRT